MKHCDCTLISTVSKKACSFMRLFAVATDRTELHATDNTVTAMADIKIANVQSSDVHISLAVLSRPWLPRS